MKRRLSSLVILGTVAIAACQPMLSSGSDNRPAHSVAFAVDEFTFEEISGRGCGMTLWSPERSSGDRYLFFHGLNESPMEMKIDGKIVRFKRTEASGTEFYGQQTTQTFVSEDGMIQVTAEVVLGPPGEIESVAIPSGTLRISQTEQAIDLSVIGDAGC